MGESEPASRLRKVDLPQPFGPTRATRESIESSKSRLLISGFEPGVYEKPTWFGLGVGFGSGSGSGSGSG